MYSFVYLCRHFLKRPARRGKLSKLRRALCRGRPMMVRHRPVPAKSCRLSDYTPQVEADSGKQYQHPYSSHPRHFKMSFAGPMPLKAVAPIRIAGSRSFAKCQRRCIATQAARTQSRRPSIAQKQQQHNAQSMRVCPSRLQSVPNLDTNMLCTVLPRLSAVLRHGRPVPDTRSQ
jgi:hypothetical protein